MSDHVKETWRELYELELSDIPGNKLIAAYRSVMKRWTYNNPPKPGDFIKEVDELFPSQTYLKHRHIDEPPPEPTQSEIDDKNRVGMLFKLFRNGFFNKLNPNEAKEFTDNFNKSPVEECDNFTRDYIANKIAQPLFEILDPTQIEVTL